MKRGLLVTTISMIVLMALVGLLTATSSAADSAQKADVLFVQTAHDVTFDGKKLILKGISPTVLFFTDRPERVAGNMANDRYLKLWQEDGKDSFLADPPNATLSVFADDAVGEMVVTLRNPQFAGDDLIYDISVIKGKPLEKGGPCALFIDIIGMPLTPLSYAGVARRSVYRRW
ncbi:MAG: hypothetical protein WAM73_10180 [Desulfobacterales bacterium]